MDRKEFMGLPMEERRKRLTDMANDPALIEYYKELGQELFPNKCGEGKPEGRHFYHSDACSWHDGECEAPTWCECSYRENT